MRTKTENGPQADLEQLLEDIKVVVHDGQQLLKHGVGDMKERARIGAKTTDRVVRENLYQTVGLVFGVGLIAGMICYGIFSHREEEGDSQ